MDDIIVHFEGFLTIFQVFKERETVQTVSKESNDEARLFSSQLKKKTKNVSSVLLGFFVFNLFSSSLS